MTEASVSSAVPRRLAFDNGCRLYIVDSMEAALSRNESIPPSLPVYLAERLAEEIETNVLKPGERLSEEAIARRFGVSRAPVREALRLLAQEEVVVIEARRGARVRSYSREELSEMFEMRAVLYGLAVELFTRRATAELLAGAARLGQKVISAAHARDVKAESFAAATQAFTSHVVGHCGNARLAETIRKMTRRSFRHFAILAHSTAAHRAVVAQYARRMADAMARRDSRSAGTIARELVDRNHEEVLRHLAAAGDQADRLLSGNRRSATKRRLSGRKSDDQST